MTETVLSQWGAVAMVGLLAAAWVAVEWLKRRCRHEWEDTGRVTRVLPHPSMSTLTDENGKLVPLGYNHHLRCKHCGDMKVFSA